MLNKVRQAKLLIGGEWISGDGLIEVTDKFSGNVIGHAARATREQVDAAVAAAKQSFDRTKLEPYRRFEILRRTSELIEQHRAEFIETIIAESGFPFADANNEVTRSVETFLLSAEEAKRISGEVVPIEGAAGQSHRMAFTIRVPRGVVCGITSFNSPLNMVAHKMAPALAGGNTVVMKPPSSTPFSAAILCELLIEAGLPPGHVNLVQGPGAQIGNWLTANQDIRFYTFTGSTEVGKALQRAVGLRPIALELGSIAATIVCEDADLERATPRCVNSAFRRAGQACTSVQRLFVHESVMDRFAGMLVDATRALRVGNPHDTETVVGPMISVSEAERAERWIGEAVQLGAKIIHGGRRDGALLYPTILGDVRRDMKVMCEEIFAPVMSLVPYSSFDDVLRQVNSTPFGLAAGIFTRDINRALRAARQLHVGIVHINESSTSRVDLIPFGGVKDSGLG
ncbi:MAG: aldehyde dehydrogenase family protein, partial [Acidobacteria bacterium]|nr:aldehyde dehydrogenase family protein [Acidobacteriota bacterium]